MFDGGDPYRGHMEVRIKHPVVFDFCRQHGVWLDRGERLPFESAFGLQRKVVGA